MKRIERREYVKVALVSVLVVGASFAFRFFAVDIFFPSVNSGAVATVDSIVLMSSTSPVEAADTDVLAEQKPMPVPGPNAIFKEKVNGALYKYYPLSVGAIWIYERYTYRFVDNGNEEEYNFVKEVSKVTVTVTRIYEEGGKEYVELGRENKITDWLKVDERDTQVENPTIKTYEHIPFPKDKELIFNSTVILEISGLNVKYVSPDYPQYIDVFPLKEGILLDMNTSQEDRWESVYGEEALVWKREKTDDYEMKMGKYSDCYKSTVYDLRGTSGSISEIVFCEGLGPVKYVEELTSYAHHSYYYRLLDFIEAPDK